MMLFRNRKFLEGVALGGICGIIIGSVLALALGEGSIGTFRHFIGEHYPRRHSVLFEYLSQ